MIPAVNIVSVPPPPATLVATPMFNTHALHAPPDNVPPSFSNAPLNNNARGNGGAFAQAENPPAPSVAETPRINITSPVGGSSSLAVNSGVSAAFLAQLIGQYAAPSLQSALNGVLSTYEKMVVNSYTKYGNSYAALPELRSVSSAYTQALQQEKAQVFSAPSEPVRAQAPAVPPQPLPQAQVTLPPKEVLSKPETPPLSRTSGAAKPKTAPATAAIAYLLTASHSEPASAGSITA